MALQAVDFEVFGRVQGVFFRKYTKEQAVTLGIRGWCMNTDKDTVLGYMEGEADKIESMMNWLKTTGSPMSQIEKAEFRNKKNITAHTLEGFTVRR